MIRIEIPIDGKDAKRRGIVSHVSRALISEPFSGVNDELVKSLIADEEYYYVFIVNSFQGVGTIVGSFESITPKSFEPNVCLKFSKKSEALSCFANTNCEIALLFSCDSANVKSIIEDLGSEKMLSFSNLQPDAIICQRIEVLKRLYSFSYTTNVLEMFFIDEVPIQLCKLQSK